MEAKEKLKGFQYNRDPKVNRHHFKIDIKFASHSQKWRTLNPKMYASLKEED